MQRQNLMAHGAEASKYEAKQWRQRARPNRTKVGPTKCYRCVALCHLGPVQVGEGDDSELSQRK